MSGARPDLGLVLDAVEAREYFFEEGCYILELSNGDHDPALSIARARVPPGVTTRNHRLQATTERYCIVSGRGEVRVGDQWHEVGPGSVVLIPPDCPQSIRNTGAQDLVFLALCTPRFRSENYHEVI